MTQIDVLCMLAGIGVMFYGIYLVFSARRESVDEISDAREKGCRCEAKRILGIFVEWTVSAECPVHCELLTLGEIRQFVGDPDYMQPRYIGERTWYCSECLSDLETLDLSQFYRHGMQRCESCGRYRFCLSVPITQLNTAFEESGIPKYMTIDEHARVGDRRSASYNMGSSELLSDLHSSVERIQ